MKTTTFVRIVFFVCLLPIFMLSCTKKITDLSSVNNLPSTLLFLESQIFGKPSTSQVFYSSKFSIAIANYL